MTSSVRVNGMEESNGPPKDVSFYEKFVFGDASSQDSSDDTLDTENDGHHVTSPLEKDHHSDENDVREQAWKDTDDDSNEELMVNLDENPKLRKLKFLDDSHASRVTRGQLQVQLKKYKLGKKTSNDWVRRLRDKPTKGDATWESTLNVSEDVSEHKKRASCFLSRVCNLLGPSQRHKLPSGKLQHYFLPDLNRHDPSHSAVTSCGFFDENKLFFTAGRDKTIRLFSTDTVDHAKRTAYHIKNKEIQKAYAWTRTCEPSILFLAGVRSIGLLNVETGSVSMLRAVSAFKRDQRFFQLALGNTNVFSVTANNGHILCCDRRMEKVALNFKMNAEGRALVYLCNKDDYLCSGDSQGIVYDWDIRASKCFTTFQDEGSLGVTSMASWCGPQGCSLAVGSSSGYVNLYGVESTRFSSEEPVEKRQCTSFFEEESWTTPTGLLSTKNDNKREFRLLKSFHNLTTTVSDLAFHPSSSILAMCSKMTREGIKLVHFPSCTVFSNFPRQKKCFQLKYPECVCFNSVGSSMGIGNSHGAVKHVELPFFLQCQQEAQRTK